MLSVSNSKYFILLSFLLIMCAVPLDYFGLNENRFATFCGIWMFGFFLVTCASVLIMFFESLYDDEDFFERWFGKSHYSFIWTFMLLPGSVYGFFLTTNGELYAGFNMVIFLFFERLRTIQNRFAQEYKDEQLKKEAWNKAHPKEEVVIK